MLYLNDIKNSKRKRFWAEVDLNAAAHNFNIIKGKLKPETKLCCVVKANAYGHGAVCLSKLYERLGADFFAVSNIEEAMQLRDNGISTPILILGYTPVECATLLAKYNISQSVFSYNYACELNAFAQKSNVNVKIHIKLDSGMGRIGFDCIHEDRDSLDDAIGACKLENIIPEGIFTHFALADEGNDGRAYTEKQYNRFTKAVDYIEKNGIHFEIKHASNSASIMDYPEYQLDMVRAGIVLYGLAPSERVGACDELLPIISLKSVILMIKNIKKGDCVSYGCTFVAEKDTKIATVPVGYADGFRRANSGVTQLLVRGRRVDIVGRICMDQLMLDVSDVPGVKEGDIVTIIGSDGGEHISVLEIAQNNSTIGYEIICEIGERVPRFYIEDDRIVYVKDNIVSYERDMESES